MTKNYKIKEDSWWDGKGSWSDNVGQWSSEHDQWAKEDREVVPALTGVDESDTERLDEISEKLKAKYGARVMDMLKSRFGFPFTDTDIGTHLSPEESRLLDKRLHGLLRSVNSDPERVNAAMRNILGHDDLNDISEGKNKRRSSKKSGISESRKFNSKQEVINYFVSRGKSAASGAAAWERGWRGPKTKTSGGTVSRGHRDYHSELDDRRFRDPTEDMSEGNEEGVTRGDPHPEREFWFPVKDQWPEILGVMGKIKDREDVDLSLSDKGKATMSTIFNNGGMRRVEEDLDPEKAKVGRLIKKYYREIQEQDALDYLRDRAEQFSRLMYIYKGDLKGIVAEEPIELLKTVAMELKHIANDIKLDENEYSDNDFDDDDEYGDNNNGFFVVIADEDGAFIGMIYKEGSKWREQAIAGNAPYNWGSSYMGYLKPHDVMSWLQKDYGRRAEVVGPFDDEESARKYAIYNFDHGSEEIEETSNDFSAVDSTSPVGGHVNESVAKVSKVKKAIIYRIVENHPSLTSNYSIRDIMESTDNVTGSIKSINSIGQKDISKLVRRVFNDLKNNYISESKEKNQASDDPSWKGNLAKNKNKRRFSN